MYIFYCITVESFCSVACKSLCKPTLLYYISLQTRGMRDVLKATAFGEVPLASAGMLVNRYASLHYYVISRCKQEVCVMF